MVEVYDIFHISVYVDFIIFCGSLKLLFLLFWQIFSNGEVYPGLSLNIHDVVERSILDI